MNSNKLLKLQFMLSLIQELLFFCVFPHAEKELGGCFGAVLFNNQDNPKYLPSEDCVYGNSLEEAIDKAIEKWS